MTVILPDRDECSSWDFMHRINIFMTGIHLYMTNITPVLFTGKQSRSIRSNFNKKYLKLKAY